jgi:hypothetical protein
MPLVLVDQGLKFGSAIASLNASQEIQVLWVVVRRFLNLTMQLGDQPTMKPRIAVCREERLQASLSVVNADAAQE